MHAIIASGQVELSAAWVGTPFYFCPFGAISAFDTESWQQFKCREARTISSLYVIVSGNNSNLPVTIVSRKNGANGNLMVIIPAGATGIFQDTTHSDSLVDGDLYCFQGYFTGMNPSGLVTITIIQTATTGTLFMGSSGEVGYTWAQMFGMIENHLDILEPGVQNVMPAAATISKAGVNMVSNSAATPTVVQSRINGANGNIIITIPAGQTGIFEDLVHSDSLNPGDLVDWMVTGGAISGIYVMWATLTSTQKPLVATNDDSNGQLLNNDFYAVEGKLSISRPESAVQVALGEAINFSCLRVYANSNAGTGDVTVKLRINGADGNLVVTIPNGQTGVFQDNTHLNQIGPTDLIDIMAVSPAGGSVWPSYVELYEMPVRIPTCETKRVNTISEIGATLYGLLDDDGGRVCACGFQYGLTTAYGNTTPTQSKNSGQSFSEVISGLSPGTLYHFRAFATNVTGTGYGPDMTFVTDSPALAAVSGMQLELAQILLEVGP